MPKIRRKSAKNLTKCFPSRIKALIIAVLGDQAMNFSTDLSFKLSP